jgi:hypothetical protein
MRAQTEDVRAAAEEELDESEVTSAGEGIALVDIRTPVKAGERASFAVDAERMHFFDPASGLAISNASPGAGQPAQLHRPAEAADLRP